MGNGYSCQIHSLVHPLCALLAGSTLGPRVVPLGMAVDAAVSIDWHNRGCGFRFPGRVGLPSRQAPG